MGEDGIKAPDNAPEKDPKKGGVTPLGTIAKVCGGIVIGAGSLGVSAFNSTASLIDKPAFAKTYLQASEQFFIFAFGIGLFTMIIWAFDVDARTQKSPGAKKASVAITWTNAITGAFGFVIAMQAATHLVALVDGFVAQLG